MPDFGFKNYKFEDLEVWKLGMKIIHETYRVIKNSLRKNFLGCQTKSKELRYL